MRSDTIFIPTRRDRRVRRCAWALSIAAHVTVGLLVLNHLAGRFRVDVDSIEPIAIGEVLEGEIGRQLAAEVTRPAAEIETDSPAIATTVEPGSSVIESAAARIVNYRDADIGPDPLATVRRNAELLERISSPGEVAKMADRLRDAMGVDSQTIKTPTADTPPVDWDHAIQSSARRVEEGDRVEIHESFIDGRGGASTMIHIRDRGPDADAFVYTMTLLERGERGTEQPCSKDEFEAAAERVRPFELMNQFPLLQELHRSAIVPIMGKLSEEEDEQEATTQPADDGP